MHHKNLIHCVRHQSWLSHVTHGLGFYISYIMIRSSLYMPELEPWASDSVSFLLKMCSSIFGKSQFDPASSRLVWRDRDVIVKTNTMYLCRMNQCVLFSAYTIWDNSRVYHFRAYIQTDKPKICLSVSTKRHSLSLSLSLCSLSLLPRPDITVMVDWALKNQ